MVLARTNDAAVEAFCPKTRLRFLYADVSETARRLARSHGCSEAAAPLLGKALAGTALAGVDFVEPGERLVVSAEVRGRAAGWLTELDGDGHLRGALHENAPETLPCEPGGAEDDFWGAEASAKATRLRADGNVRSQMAFQCRPGTPEACFTEMLSAAAPTRLCMVATLFEGEPDRVRALALQLVHEGSRREFKRVAKLFDDGTVADQLAFDATLPTMREVLSLDDLVTGPTRAIAFGCTCSRERVLESYASLPRDELEGMLRPLRPRVFRCHLCGRELTIAPEDLAQLLQKRSERR